ncbi:MAG TPA: hypothetical protein VGL91_18040 [Acidobacteriota bacterium]|jgi:hypothetical protein
MGLKITCISSPHGYIVRQKQHHKRMSFQDELLQLLKKHRVQYDERYLWD